MNDSWRIGELASALGLNPKTIRYYEAIGLLAAPRRTPTGYRVYDAADREQLDFIVKARAIGLGLDEIGDILALQRRGERPCEHVLMVLDRKIAALDEQLHAVSTARQQLVSLRPGASELVRREGRVCPIIEHYQRFGQTQPPSGAGST